MAEKHPYTPSSSGLTQTFEQLRRSFPPKVDVGILKKLDLAPKNEGQVLQVLKFISVLNTDFLKTDAAADVFSKHEDVDFQKGLAKLIETSYKDLFSLHGRDTWALSTDKLISYFRSTDKTSEIVGKRQALTFQALAVLCGHTPSPSAKPNGNSKSQENRTAPPKKLPRTTITKNSKPSIDLALPPKDSSNAFGLTVRVEINLPAVGDQDTYDKIFKSIKENLLNG